MLKDLAAWRERRRKPGSLRSELLFNLAFLAAAALFLALWTASVLQLSLLAFPNSAGLLVALVVLDVLVFVALGNYLVDRLVLRPLAQTVQVAEAIAAGDYARRIPAGSTAEIASLATALNHLTDQLLQNQGKLAENVRSLDETNRLLTQAQTELVQAEKMASIGRLAAGIAHEIGNPLGALVGYAAVLRRRGAAAELMDGIDREARRIDQIVRGLLDYARPGAARREPMSVNDSVLRVLELLRSQDHLRSVEVVLDLDPQLPGIEATPHRIDQLFVNLFENAEAAMGGVGQLTVTTRRERFVPGRVLAARRADDPPGIDYTHLRRLRAGAGKEPERLRENQEVVKVVVADSGPGIPREALESVFDPFYTTKAPGEGTGLGLAIVASTMAELGGRVDASSPEEGGATFSLLFPAAECAP